MSFKSEIQDLNARLLERGYSKKYLVGAASKVKSRSRESLLFQNGGDKVRKKAFNNETLVFSTSYGSNFSSVKNIFYKYLPVLNTDRKLRTILETGCKVVPEKGKPLVIYYPLAIL